MALHHELENLRRAAVSVLDGFGSGQDGAAHAFGCGGVHGDGHAGVAGGRDGQLHLLE